MIYFVISNDNKIYAPHTGFIYKGVQELTGKFPAEGEVHKWQKFDIRLE